MKIILCVEPLKYSRTEAEIEVADGLTDEQIDDLVQDDLAAMSAEMTDAWWERAE